MLRAVKSFAAKAQSSCLLNATHQLRVGSAALSANFGTASHRQRHTSILPANVFAPVQHSLASSAAYAGIRSAHTKGERELIEFLADEILAEKKTKRTVPAQLDGFKVTLNKADVELTKSANNEKITISFNVNHTVDTDEQEEDAAAGGKNPEFTAMKSKPQFEVDITRGGSTLSFTCSYLPGEPQEGEYNDVFGIDEVTIYEGEWNESVYAVAGDVLDGYMYDLLMNFLEEKGISNEFVDKMSDFSSAYEHANYIGLLEGLSNFTSNQK